MKPEAIRKAAKREVESHEELWLDLTDELNSDEPDEETCLYLLDELQSVIGKARSHVQKYFRETVETSC